MYSNLVLKRKSQSLLKNNFSKLFLTTLNLSIWILNINASVANATIQSGYKVDTTLLCDGLPRVNVDSIQGTCVGLLASKQDGLKMPRYGLQAKDGTIYVTEMFGWAYGRGTVYAITSENDNSNLNSNSNSNSNLNIDESSVNLKNTFNGLFNNNNNNKIKITNLFPNKKLTMPNGILMDPEGRLYVGTPTAILRFEPKNKITGEFNIDSTPEIYFDGFAKSVFRTDEYKNANSYNTLQTKNKNKHPLIQMAQNKDFSEMYINIGAPSDDCGSGFKTINEDTGQCIQSESPLASAAVWKLNLTHDFSRKVIVAEPFARGLRNSMALAVHPQSGFVFQGENSMDLTEQELPYEELNILSQGGHYGWPYCHSQNQVSPKFQDTYTSDQCKNNYLSPKIFMPAHTAPLGLLFYNNSKLSMLKNKLLVSWHGYQKYGHRVVAYSVDSKGVPTTNQHESVIFNWESQDGIRPRGAPTGMFSLQDGTIIVVDDKNGAVLRLSVPTLEEQLVYSAQQEHKNENETKENNSNSNSNSSSSTDTSSTSNESWSAEALSAFDVMRPFLQKNCAMCHTPFQKNTSLEILNEMQKAGMFSKSSPRESSFVQKITSQQMPPQDIKEALQITEEQMKELIKQLENFLHF